MEVQWDQTEIKMLHRQIRTIDYTMEVVEHLFYSKTSCTHGLGYQTPRQ